MGGPPSPPPQIYQPPTPVPTQADPAIAEAARRQRVIEAGIEGRGATLMAGAVQTDPSRRLGARLLGNFSALG